MYPNILTLGCFLLFSFSLVSASKNITFTECDDEVSQCVLHGMWMDSCRNPLNDGDICIVNLGKKAGVSLDLTFQFDATALQNRLYWHKGRSDIPFMDMGTDACELTQCPIETNQRKTINFEILLGRKYPLGTFNINWKIWNSDNETQQCCVNFDIKLVRK